MSISSDIAYLSSYFSIPQGWINNVISFESSWNPLALNPVSGAMGLIQFTDSTARSMGYESAFDLVSKYPDADSQLMGPVFDYLKGESPFSSEQDFYMSIFLPSLRSVAPDTLITGLAAEQNVTIQTVQDYINSAQNAGEQFLNMLTDTD